MKTPVAPRPKQRFGDVPGNSPSLARHDEEKHRIRGKIGTGLDVLPLTLLQRCRNGMSHYRFRRVHHGVAAFDQLREGSMFFAARQKRASSQSLVKAPPLVEDSTTERHVVAVSDTTE